MPQPATARGAKAIVLRTEGERLAQFLRTRESLPTLLESGVATRTKVAESWLYHPASIAQAEFVHAARSAANSLLAEWLTVPLSIMSGMLSASMQPSCSKGAARALLHRLVSDGTLARIGLLTASDEPHLAVYRPSDTDEIARQQAYLRRALFEQKRRVHLRQLPDPLRRRAGRGWASTIMSHAEFAGWGRLADGELRPWPAP